MLELAALALLNTAREWGREPVIATRIVAADPVAVRALVCDAASQRLLEGISPRLRAVAHAAPSRHPRFAHATVTLGRREALWITWILTPRRGTTEVDLAAQLELRSAVARAAWALGGGRWLRRRLEATLGTLAALALRAAEDLDDVERDAARPASVPAQRAT